MGRGERNDQQAGGSPEPLVVPPVLLVVILVLGAVLFVGFFALFAFAL